MKEEKIPEFPGFLKILGPGIIWLALAQGSGELIWWPYIAAKYGGALLFLLIPSALVQLPLTYYIGRYSLLTGESIMERIFKIKQVFFNFSLDYDELFVFLVRFICGCRRNSFI
jgi:Mn2+/Fe2+ NRAMP family transporter